MQTNRVKKVFKRNNQGYLVSLCGDMFHPGHMIESNIIDTLTFQHLDSIRACKGNQVFEVHVDKYNNIIYREYEKNS